MHKLLKASEELFFNMLLLCMMGSIYFILLPINSITIAVGFVFSVFYFGFNFYAGYKYNLNLIESLITGIFGNGVGVFLGFFSAYSYFIVGNESVAVDLMKSYYISTTSILEIFFNGVDISYPFLLIIINTLLVVVGSCLKKCLRKIDNKVCTKQLKL